jgi:hypothetical protein
MRVRVACTMLACLGAAAFITEPLAAQSPSPDLSSGGLAPPPAVESQKSAEAPQPAAGTEQELSLAEQKDAGRGLEFLWFAGEVGGGHFGLGTFDGGNLVDRSAVEMKQTGLVAGAGLGLRLVYLTLGARFRYAPFSKWTLWTLGAEGGIHVPMGSLEPYFTLGLGYASITPDGGGFDVMGFDSRLGAGIDYYLTNMFSVGANLTGDMLFLSRSKVAGAPTSGPGAVYAEDGSSIGGGVALTAVMGLHF